MKPPYSITPKILKLISSISEQIGEVNAKYLNRPSPELRKRNLIKTIHSSLSIEGNTLTLEQVTAVLDDKKVIGPKKDILEVLNANELYAQLSEFNPHSENSFLNAHKILMKGLIDSAGKYRKKSVGIAKGENVEHIAPPYDRVPHLMKDLFAYLKSSDDLSLVKSCVFHYEMEFIHPFIDGNGRMGRLWQSLILMKDYSLFQYLPFETLISKHQEEYYRALSESDKKGNSTLFIEYMLEIIAEALKELLEHSRRNLTQSDRLEYFLSLHIKEFTRKDYMKVFSDISSATASRDLNFGVRVKKFKKIGEKNKTKYFV